MRRWISCVRPDWRPFVASRGTRSDDEPGSSEYSAVTHPLPEPRNHRGSSASTDAVQRTFVRPIVTSTDPAANSVKSRTISKGRSSSGLRPSWRTSLVILGQSPSPCVPGRPPRDATVPTTVPAAHPDTRWGHLGGSTRTWSPAEHDGFRRDEFRPQQTAPHRDEPPQVAGRYEPVSPFRGDPAAKPRRLEDGSHVERRLLS